MKLSEFRIVITSENEFIKTDSKALDILSEKVEKALDEICFGDIIRQKLEDKGVINQSIKIYVGD